MGQSACLLQNTTTIINLPRACYGLVRAIEFGFSDILLRE